MPLEEPRYEPSAIRCLGCQQIDNFRDDQIGESDKGKPWIRVVLRPIQKLRGIQKQPPPSD